MSVDFSSSTGVGEAKDYDFSEAGIVEIRREEKEPSFEESERFQTLNFSERIQKIEEGIFTTTVIDRVIRVRTLSQDIIRDKLGFWEQRKVKATQYGFGAAIIGIGSIALAIWKQSATASILCIGGLLIASYQLSQYAQATGQIQKWNRDFVKEIADQRLLAFKKGRIHIYKEDHARRSSPNEFQKILSKNELQGLYYKYFHSFVRMELAGAQDDTSKVKLLSDAARFSPLASHIYRYAFLPEEKINQSEEIFKRYNVFLSAYNSVDTRIQNEIARVHESYKTPIEMIEKEKEKAIQLATDNYEIERAELLKKRTAKLEGHPPTGVEIEDHHANVKEEYEERLRGAKAAFEKEKKQLLEEPEKDLKKLQEEKGKIIASIQMDRRRQLLLLFPFLLALHQEAYKLYMGESYDLSVVDTALNTPPFLTFQGG